MNIGKVIKDTRKQRRQTQTEFALSCGITQTYLSQIENNVKEPNLSTLKTISANLDIPLPIMFFMSLNELFFGNIPIIFLMFNKQTRNETIQRHFFKNICIYDLKRSLKKRFINKKIIAV